MGGIHQGLGVLTVLMLGGSLLMVGCASTGQTAERDRLTERVGEYPPPPAGVERARVGVPPFQVQMDRSISGGPGSMNEIAADQMSGLLHLSRRFDVIERAQLGQVLGEQDLEGIVRDDELAQAGQVEGVDYLLIGRVTNFRVRADETRSGVGVDVGGISRAFGGRRDLGRGTTGFDRHRTEIVTEAGVDIRLVDPTSGRVVAQHFGEFNRSDTAAGLGISVGEWIRTEADAHVQIERDDAGRILRLAFDEALQRMLPEIDQVLAARQQELQEALAEGEGS